MLVGVALLRSPANYSCHLQTLRAVRRRLAVAKRLECVRLQRRFPKAGCDSIAAGYKEDLRGLAGMPPEMGTDRTRVRHEDSPRYLSGCQLRPLSDRWLGEGNSASRATM